MRVAHTCLAVTFVLGAAGCSRKAASIDLSPKKLKIYGIGNSQRVAARLLDKKGQPIEEGSVAWFSSQNDVATVDSSGRVTAKGTGKAMVEARFEKISSKIPIEVIDVKTIDISPPSLQLTAPAGTRFPLQAVIKDSKGKSVDIPLQWTSSKPPVASVDAHGVVSTVGPGVSTIVARLGDLQAGCEVTVTVREIERLQLRPATVLLRAGETQRFDVIGFGADGKPIEGISTVFESSDPAVARVDPLGTALGIAPGTATIRAMLGSQTAEAMVLVSPPLGAGR